MDRASFGPCRLRVAGLAGEPPATRKEKQRNQQTQQKHIKKATQTALALLVITSTLLLALPLAPVAAGLAPTGRNKQQPALVQFDADDASASEEEPGEEFEPVEEQPQQQQLVEKKRSEQLPESIYKNAPLLFGAATDYFNEPPASRPKLAPAQLPRKQPLKSTPTSASGKGVGTSNQKLAPKAHAASVTSGRGSQTGRSVATTKNSQKFANEPNSSRKRSVVAEVAAISPEMSASALRDMERAGVSMDQVLSSLGLVVEAMKQQTMAMQMISGHMAAVKQQQQAQPEAELQAKSAGGSAAKAPMDPRALLESFGEIMNGFRSARAASPSQPTSGDSTKTVLDSFGDTVRVGAMGTVRGLAADEPLTLVQQPLGEPALATTFAPSTTTTSTQRPTTTTTTTTTTTPAPTTPTTTTTTSRAPEPTAPATTTTTTSAPRPTEPATTAIAATESSRYKIMPQPTQGPGWRRVVPFDFYPFTGSVESAGEPAMSKGPAMTMTDAVMPAGEQPPARAVAFPVYSGLGENHKSVGMPSYAMPEQAPKQAQMSHQAYLMSMIQQQQQQQKPAKLPQYSMMAGKEAGNQMALVQQMLAAKGYEQPPSGDVGQKMKLMMSMMAAEEQQQQQEADLKLHEHQQVMQLMMQQQQPMHQMQQPMQQMQQQTESLPGQELAANMMNQEQSLLSDEVPRPPTTHMRAPEAKGAPQQMQPGLKIGERPQFDPSNFQILSKGATKTGPTKEQESGEEEPSLKGGPDLTGTASNSQEVETSGKEGAKELVEEAGGSKKKQQQAPKKLMIAPSPPPKQPSFSILGGRFKITPHTQMLHALLEPSKNLLQQALGSLMGPANGYGPQWAPTGSGGYQQVLLVQQPALQAKRRAPRRLQVKGLGGKPANSAKPAAGKPTSGGATGKKQPAQKTHKGSTAAPTSAAAASGSSSSKQ